MFKRCLLRGLTVLLFYTLTIATPITIAAQSGTNIRRTEQVKSEVTALGVNTSVSVKLQNGKKLRGVISQIGDDNFVVTDAKTSVNNAIVYSEVAHVKRARAKGRSLNEKLLIGGAITVSTLFVLSYVKNVLTH